MSKARRQKLSMFKGTVTTVLHQIKLDDVDVDDDCSVSLQDVRFPASFDIERGGLVVPGSCPVWEDNDLPFRVPLDGQAPHWRSVLPPCPLIPVFGALPQTLEDATSDPNTSPRMFDLITERKNLRKLLDFVDGKSIKYRIDAEVIGRTLLFYDSWLHDTSLSGYSSTNSYGRNFERYFTCPVSPGLVEHGRIVTYTFGGLRVMVKYEADACIRSSSGENLEEADAPSSTTTHEIGGMKITNNPLKKVVPGADMLEIKTTRTGKSVKPDTMGQLWFSQTPNVYHGVHDGNGLFTDVYKQNVVDNGSLKRWEEGKAGSLRRLAKLLSMIRDQLCSSETKRVALLFSKERDPNRHVVEFRQFQGSYRPNSLPVDIRQKWFM